MFKKNEICGLKSLKKNGSYKEINYGKKNDFDKKQMKQEKQENKILQRSEKEKKRIEKQMNKKSDSLKPKEFNFDKMVDFPTIILLHDDEDMYMNLKSFMKKNKNIVIENPTSEKITNILTCNSSVSSSKNTKFALFFKNKDELFEKINNELQQLFMNGRNKNIAIVVKYDNNINNLNPIIKNNSDYFFICLQYLDEIVYDPIFGFENKKKFDKMRESIEASHMIVLNRANPINKPNIFYKNANIMYNDIELTDYECNNKEESEIVDTEIWDDSEEELDENQEENQEENEEENEEELDENWNIRIKGKSNNTKPYKCTICKPLPLIPEYAPEIVGGGRNFNIFETFKKVSGGKNNKETEKKPIERTVMTQEKKYSLEELKLVIKYLPIVEHLENPLKSEKKEIYVSTYSIKDIENATKYISLFRILTNFNNYDEY